jgi:hypothetical protein
MNCAEYAALQQLRESMDQMQGPAEEMVESGESLEAIAAMSMMQSFVLVGVLEELAALRHFHERGEPLEWTAANWKAEGEAKQ